MCNDYSCLYMLSKLSLTKMSIRNQNAIIYYSVVYHLYTKNNLDKMCIVHAMHSGSQNPWLNT